MSFLTFPVVFTAGTFLFFFAVLVLITAYRLGRLKEKNEYERACADTKASFKIYEDEAKKIYATLSVNGFFSFHNEIFDIGCINEPARWSCDLLGNDDVWREV